MSGGGKGKKYGLNRAGICTCLVLWDITSISRPCSSCLFLLYVKIVPCWRHQLSVYCSARTFEITNDEGTQESQEILFHPRRNYAVQNKELKQRKKQCWVSLQSSLHQAEWRCSCLPLRLMNALNIFFLSSLLRLFSVFCHSLWLKIHFDAIHELESFLYALTFFFLFFHPHPQFPLVIKNALCMCHFTHSALTCTILRHLIAHCWVSPKLCSRRVEISTSKLRPPATFTPNKREEQKNVKECVDHTKWKLTRIGNVSNFSLFTRLILRLMFCIHKDILFSIFILDFSFSVFFGSSPSSAWN